MATETSTQVQPAALYGDPSAIQTLLAANAQVLLAVHEHLRKQKVPFRVVIPSTAATQGAQILSAHRGEILTVSNPTAAPVVLQLVEGDVGQIIQITVPAGGYANFFVPFFGRVFAKQGAALVVSGYVYP